MLAISYPFRFSAGRVPQVDTDTDEYRAQIVGSVLRTNVGELLLSPNYGTLAPEFTQLDTAGLMYTVSAYHPRIVINKVEEKINKETQEVEIRVEFSEAADGAS